MELAELKTRAALVPEGPSAQGQDQELEAAANATVTRKKSMLYSRSPQSNVPDLDIQR